MVLSPYQQTAGLALLRISPVFLAAVSGTFSYISHEYVAAFKHKDVTYEARSAVIPGWWDHIRPVSLPVIWLSFIPNFFLGVANSRSSTLWGWLGDGSKGAVGPLASKLYLIGGLVSIFMDFQRGWTAGFPVCVLFLAATTAWVADQL